VQLHRHNRCETPAYLIWIHHKPFLQGKGKASYARSVKDAAKKSIHTPILTNDIEIEVFYSTNATTKTRADVDNILKPTLDALKEIAFGDDSQVRSVSSRLFDRNVENTIAGRVEHIGRLFFSEDNDVLLIAIYSDSRLSELGGHAVVNDNRFKEWTEDFDYKLKQMKQPKN